MPRKHSQMPVNEFLFRNPNHYRPMNTTRQTTPGFRNQRGRIKAYRASGQMFGQAFHTDSKWNVTKPPAKICPCGYIMETYTQPCPQGHDWNSLST